MSNLVIKMYYFVFAVILANSSSTSEADKLPCSSIPPFLQEICSNHPLVGWIFWLITVLAAVVTGVAAFTGALQKIIDFCKKNLLRKPVEVPESKLLELRKQLLKRLQGDISIRRQNSLHNLIKIDLEMEEQRRQVGGKMAELVPQDPEPENNNPLNRVFRFLTKDNQQTTQLKQSQKIIDFFDRNDINGKLLILGEPGAGKTTELLSLNQDLIQRAINDKNTPIPIIFELSSWKNDQAIRDWLIGQLTEIYKGIPKKVAEQWIDNQQLIPLLDGLDELGLERQNKCIIAINEFLDSSFQPGLVVCCRREEYEQAQTKLEQLNGAIYIESLSDNQIQQYLKSLKRSFIWNENIRNESELLELVRKPLFLTMLVVAYQGRAIKNTSELFEAYIVQQLNNPDNQGTYPPRKSPSQKQTLHYLVWLARKLEAEKETEFLIEKMQPTWLESNKQKIAYRMIFGLMLGLIFGLFVGLFVGLIFGLDKGLIGGLIFGLLFVIGGVMAGGVIGWSSGELLSVIELRSVISNKALIQKLKPIKPTEKISWSFRKFRKVFRKTFSTIGLIFGLMSGLIGGLIFGLMKGFSSSEIDHKNHPNQGIWNSLKNGLFAALFIGLIYGVIDGLIFALSFELKEELKEILIFELKEILIVQTFFLSIVVIVFGMYAGLGSVIKHFALRIILYQNGHIPWNYAKFLDHAAKHRFIQRVGGRYRFMHDLLRKHFAQMSLS